MSSINNLNTEMWRHLYYINNFRSDLTIMQTGYISQHVLSLIYETQPIVHLSIQYVFHKVVFAE